MVTVDENAEFTDYVFGIRFLDSSKLAMNQKNDNDVAICRHDIIVLYLLSSLVSGPRFMSISSLVQEL